MHQKSIKIWSGALRAASGAAVGPRNPKRSFQFCLFHVFLRKSEILGAILGPSGSRRGSQNRVFGHHVDKKREKGGPGAVPETT